MATNILLFQLEKSSKEINDLLSEVGKEKDSRVQKVKDLKEVLQYVKLLPKPIIIFQCSNKPELVNVLEMIRKLKKLANNNYVKIVGFNLIENPKVPKALMKEGVRDLLDISIKSKSLKYKIDIWNKALKEQSKGKKDVGEKSFHMQAPLDIEEDMWILKEKTDMSMIMKRYLIKMLGPSPAMAKWERVRNKNDPSSEHWKLSPIKRDDVFFQETGFWYFSGKKPEFEWKTNKWVFSGDEIALFYLKDGKMFNRFNYEDGTLNMAENSDFAMSKEGLIAESLDPSIEVNQNEVYNDENTTMEGDEDRETDKTYRASKEKEEYGGNLEGEVDGTDIYEGPLKGKGSKADEVLDYLDGKTKKGADELGGHYDGEGKTDSIDGSPYSGEDNSERSESKELEIALKKSESKELEISLEKKNSSDNDFSFEDDGPSLDNLSGKGSTDQLNHDPLSGELNTDEESDFSPEGNVLPFENKKKKEIEAMDWDSILQEPEINMESGELNVSIMKPHDKSFFLVAVFQDFFEGELSLQVDTDTPRFSDKEEVQVDFEFNYDGKNILLNIRGEILSEDWEENEGSLISLSTQNVSAEDFNQFMDLYQSRQESINEFMRQARGISE